MKQVRPLLSILMLIILPTLAFAAKHQAIPVPVRGAVMSAETNKPIPGVLVTFYARSKGAEASKPVSTVISDVNGSFGASLETGSYTWTAKTDGFGLAEGRISIGSKQSDKVAIYLRKEAKISGRLVDGNANVMSGVSISFGRWAGATTGADGKFTVNGLDSHGYEPKLLKPAGWVLEKNEYLYLSPEETKVLGDMVVRRAGSVKVLLNPVNNTAKRPVNRANISFSGNELYRNSITNNQGYAVFDQLPPGHYSVSSSDERLKNTSREFDLTEGKNITITLNSEIKPPNLSIEDYNNIFLPDKPVKLRSYGLWVDKVDACIYTVDGNSLLDGRTRITKPDEIPAVLLRPVTRFTVTFKSRRDGYTRNTRVPIPALKPGAYLLELKGNGASARFGFLVTRLGLVAKKTPGSTLLYAIDLISGKALQGVTIHTPGGTDNITTDADGMAQWRASAKETVLAGRLSDSLAFLELGSDEENGKAAGHKGYVYTDRPAYRPGQTVYFKGVLRKRAGEGYNLPTLNRAHIGVNDSGDKTVCEMDADVNAMGSFRGECSLTAGTALGGYTISASANGESWQGWFKVLEYRKPEFEVKQTPDRRFLVAGDTATVTLGAKYYFGAPVAKGKVSWRIYSQPAWGLSGDNDPGQSDEEDRDYGGYSDFIGEGDTTLDENGNAWISIVAQNHDMPYTYTLEVDVTDVSSRKVSSSAYLTVVPSLVSLNVKSGSYLSKPEAPVEIYLKAGSWEGAPRALPVDLEFVRQHYDRKSGISSWSTADSFSLKTGPDGVARTTYSFPQSGYWQVKALARDPAGRTSMSTTSVWVWEDGYKWEGSYRDLEAEFDRKLYKPGETARLIVRSPGTGGSLLLTLEGRDIKYRRKIPLKSMVEVVELPVDESYAPYIHVSAVTVLNGRFFSRTIPLRVDVQPAKLDIQVKTDKSVYAPGDTVRLNITSTTASRPVPAELSLAVVDEAIFSVAPERKDDIYRFFRGEREHLVTTLNSFPRVYLGGGSKDSASLAARTDELRGLKIRKTFKDTAFWLPMLTTNPDGSVSAEFTLPDNLTTWRATAVGHTVSSDFGMGRGKFIARLELMARLSPPRFFTVGDELRVPGVITSMGENPQTANGRFEVNGLTLLEDGSFSGEIPPHGTLRRDMPLRAAAPGTATLRLLAKGLETGDAMELNLPVLARGISRTAEGGIVLREQESTTTLQLPDNALPGSTAMKLSFSPTIADSLNSAISRLVQFPYGCVEQTLSRFIPAVHARALLADKAWQPDPATAEKLPLAIEEGLKRLEDMQHDDGGWGWWKQDATSLTMTSHVLYCLGLAKRAGLEIPQQLSQRGLKALENLTSTASADELPRAYRAISINGSRNQELESRIRSSWKKLDVADRLAFCEALAFRGAGDELTPLLEELKRDLRNEGTASYIIDKDADSWWYGWRWGSSAVETTSSMLSMIVKQNPKDPLASRLAEFLARRQSGGWWQTTTASAAAVKALADYVAATGEARGAYTASLTLNGSEVATYRIESGKIISGKKELTISPSSLSKGNNTVKLRKNGDGAAYLSTLLEYAVPPEFSTSSPGLKLQRALYRVSSAKSGVSWRHEYIPLKPDEPLVTGDDVEVRLIVENDRALEYVIVEDRLPAGFESRETDRDPHFMDDSNFFGWYSHKERRDEKMAFFIDALPAGRHEFRHVIYPELEGKIIAMPAAVWPMYQPEMRGESKPWRVEVVKR